MVCALFDEAGADDRHDLLNYFAEVHDHSAANLAAAWGKADAMDQEERLQLHMLVAGSSFYILAILEYLIEEAQG